MTHPSDDQVAAHYEAAHAVVMYRVAGHTGGRTSIEPGEGRQRLGHTSDSVTDSANLAHVEGTILSLYAGGHAQRRLDPALQDEGCGGDNALAADWLEQRGWEDREQEFRERARALVEQHWKEIEAVAVDLLHFRTLDETEVESIADIAAGSPDVTLGDLARYRRNFLQR